MKKSLAFFIFLFLIPIVESKVMIGYEVSGNVIQFKGQYEVLKIYLWNPGDVDLIYKIDPGEFNDLVVYKRGFWRGESYFIPKNTPKSNFKEVSLLFRKPNEEERNSKIFLLVQTTNSTINLRQKIGIDLKLTTKEIEPVKKESFAERVRSEVKKRKVLILLAIAISISILVTLYFYLKPI